MPLKRGADGLPALGVPEPQRIVVAARDDARAIGTECYAPHQTVMPLEWRADGLPALGIGQRRSDSNYELRDKHDSFYRKISCRNRATSFAYMSTPTAAVICFLAKGKMVRFLLPLPDRSDKRGRHFLSRPDLAGPGFCDWHDVPHARAGVQKAGKLRTGRPTDTENDRLPHHRT